MIRYVLVATDGSPVSRKAEDLAVSLARAFQGRLLAISVVHVRSEEERGDQMARAMEAVQALKQRAVASGVEVEARVERGPPADVIVNVAREHGVDAIVLGTSSRVGLNHALLGSVAEKVVRTADRTVIIAK